MRRARSFLFPLAALALAAGCADNLSDLPVLTPVQPAQIAVAPLPIVPIRWGADVNVADDPLPRPAGAPMGLTSAEGVGLQIVAFEASAVVDEPLAFTELHFTFQNPAPRAIEGRFEMILPPGAAVSRFAMKQETGWQEGEVVELQAARAAYEDALHRRTDPALLEKQAGNRFQARVFPIPASGQKEIIVSYSQELTSTRDPYRLYLRGLPRLGRLDLRVVLDDHAPASGAGSRRAFELHEADFLPDRDYALPLAGAAPDRGLRHDELVVGRVRPVAESRPDPVRDLLVLFDTSASRALDLRAQVDHLAALVAQLQAQGGGELPLAVACFDQELAPIYVGPAGGFGKREIDAILERRALGATDLGFALSAAAAFTTRKGKTFHRALLLTDGVPTAGPTEGSAFRAELASLREAGLARLDVLVTGGIRDEALLHALVVGGLPHDGLVLDGDLAPRALAERLGQATTSGIAVRVPGATWSWPTTVSGVQPGDDVLAYASVPSGAPFEVELTGPLGTSKHPVATTHVERPLLERAAARAQIDRLGRARDDAKDDEGRAKITQDIVDLSTKSRVLSDFTALLVLETDADYARFHLDRRALSDILVVGPGGVDLLRRAAPAQELTIAASPPGDTDRDGVADGADKDARPSKKKEEERPRAGNAVTRSADAPAPAAPPRERSLASAAKAAGKDTEKRPAAPPSPSMAAAEAPAPPPPPPPPPAPTASPRREPAPTFERAPSPKPSARAPAKADRSAFDDSGPANTWQGATGHARPPASVVARPRPPSPVVARVADPEESGPSPYIGKLAEVMSLLAAKRAPAALELALAWHDADPGDVLALVAMGECWEALGKKALAGRAYGSIIDLFPGRADLRRFAGSRLARLGMGEGGWPDLTLDTFQKAVASRPDHPSSHRFYAYALARAGHFEKAFDAIVAGYRHGYPTGRFLGWEHVLYDDVSILAAAWLRAEPKSAARIRARAAENRVEIATSPSLRFVLTWETDANDVDFHIRDGQGGHAFYSKKQLPSGGELYADVTTGYGPECFAIPGKARAYPYRIQAHYYSRGPMGYGMGHVEILEHDGRGGLRFEERPFVVMTDRAFVNLGKVDGPLAAK